MSEQRNHVVSSRIAGAIGNVIEWYDFALFGYFAPIIAPLFFPSKDPTNSLLFTWGVFASGFLMRPLGAMVFGFIGDRIGRRRVLYLSAVLMASPTLSLGFLPTYSLIGFWAPLLFVLIRLIQGFSVGGEFTGSVTYMVESAPPARRGMAGSWANVGSMSGILAGSGVVTLVTSLLAKESVNSWGWRLPFVFGGVLGAISLLLVSRLHEIHIRKRDEKHARRSPLKEALTRDRRRSLAAIFFVSGYGVIFYIPLVYLPNYVSAHTSMALDRAMQINTAATVVLLFFIPLFAWISDRLLRRRTLLLVGFFAMAATAYPMFQLLRSGGEMAVIAAQMVFGVLAAVPLGTAPALLVELFPEDDRLTGYALSYNIGAGVVGGTTPLMATWLIDLSGTSLAPCYYLIVWAAISLGALALMRDRSREPLL